MSATITDDDLAGGLPFGLNGYRRWQPGSSHQPMLQQLIIEVAQAAFAAGRERGEETGPQCARGDCWAEANQLARVCGLSLQTLALALGRGRADAAGEVDRLRDLIHRDKTGLALGLNRVQRIAKGFDWVCEGRGPYEHDDDRYRMEVASLITQVLEVAEQHLRASGDLAHEAFYPRAKETARMLAEDTAAPVAEPSVCEHVLDDASKRAARASKCIRCGKSTAEMGDGEIMAASVRTSRPEAAP